MFTELQIDLCANDRFCSFVGMRKQGSKNATEEERRRAVEMVVHEDVSAEIVAKTLGRAQRTIQSWIQKSDYGRNLAELKTRKAPGAKPRLTPGQKNSLVRILRAGPQNAGFDGQLWTGPRVAQVIEGSFGVKYHDHYIPSLLSSLGWSVQKPRQRAVERDDARVASWVANDWPRIKKKLAD